MPGDVGRFIVLEGLAGVGKSTIAPLLAADLGAELIDTQVPELERARGFIDLQRSVQARLHFWMMANYVVSDVVRGHLLGGRDVVIESYFYRTLATHAAMGARHVPVVDWDRAVAPDLAVELTVRESVRQQRLINRQRGGRVRYWSMLAESGLMTLRGVYDSFALTEVDTTGLAPHEVAALIRQLLDEPQPVSLAGVRDVR